MARSGFLFLGIFGAGDGFRPRSPPLRVRSLCGATCRFPHTPLPVFEDTLTTDEVFSLHLHRSSQGLLSLISKCTAYPVNPLRSRFLVLRDFWSGRRVSNPRPQAWEARALPAEPRPLSHNSKRKAPKNQGLGTPPSFLIRSATFFASGSPGGASSRNLPRCLTASCRFSGFFE